MPIVENPPLARSLFRSVEPGQSIPHDLYAAVAAILAFLYRQRVEEKMRASAREPRPHAGTERHRQRAYRPPRVAARLRNRKIQGKQQTDFGTTDAHSFGNRHNHAGFTEHESVRQTSPSANGPAVEGPGAGTVSTQVVAQNPAPESQAKGSSLLRWLTPEMSRRAHEMLLPATAISMVLVMLVPLPAFALDLLLTISITASFLVFLSAVQLRRAVEFSVFPTLLLLLTLFRLSLNLASSRRILLHGFEGTGAAGQVIEAFGQFVVGGNYIVGFVVFLALIAIQFLVVSHGAVRTAEVTARFTLDALPGKQMAIDADLNAGVINEATARKRREAIAREAEFYGAMDGAARFNQRDSMATILITAINIIAGLLIGVFQQNIAVGEALRTYTVLTVGDGLVTTIPSLLVSVAGGIVLTRAASSSNSLGTEIGAQIFRTSQYARGLPPVC